MSEPVTDLTEPIYDRQLGESVLWFRRFCLYRNQIGRRSLLEAVNAEAARGGKGRSNKAPGSWDRAKRQWQWDKRCETWDLVQQQVDDQLWDERYKKWREATWEHSERLMSKAQLMLVHPVTRQIVQQQDGVTLVTIEAVDWYQFMPALKMLIEGVRLGEKAIGNLNVAASLLTQAGFTISDPTQAGFDSIGPKSEDLSADLTEF